jgi:hypothetical protein
MSKRLPQLRKTISGFVSDESGRISKHSILTVGALAAGAASVIPKAGAQICATYYEPCAVECTPFYCATVSCIEEGCECVSDPGCTCEDDMPCFVFSCTTECTAECSPDISYPHTDQNSFSDEGDSVVAIHNHSDPTHTESASCTADCSGHCSSDCIYDGICAFVSICATEPCTLDCSPVGCAPML